MFNGGKIAVSKYNINYNKIFKSKGLGNKVELSGFTGYIEFSGDLDLLYLLLRAGKIIHIGSRTSYGLGKYELTVL
jgi:CRISPR/Cas system endoribonuclease Cas6 (RAMP superfamily)